MSDNLIADVTFKDKMLLYASVVGSFVSGYYFGFVDCNHEYMIASSGIVASAFARESREGSKSVALKNNSYLLNASLGWGVGWGITGTGFTIGCLTRKGVEFGSGLVDYL
jgi:hypothetical protein